MMDKNNEEVDPKQLQAEKERLEALAEQEAERKAKHHKIEVEREKERQRIRDKVYKDTKMFNNFYKIVKN